MGDALKLAGLAIYLGGIPVVYRTFTNPDAWKQEVLAATWPVSVPLLIAFSRKKQEGEQS
jgi:hypothetical protein